MAVIEMDGSGALNRVSLLEDQAESDRAKLAELGELVTGLLAVGEVQRSEIDRLEVGVGCVADIMGKLAEGCERLASEVQELKDRVLALGGS